MDGPLSDRVVSTCLNGERLEALEAVNFVCNASHIGGLGPKEDHPVIHNADLVFLELTTACSEVAGGMG